MRRHNGAEALPWLNSLPEVIEAMVRRFDLTPYAQFESYEAIVFEASAPSLGRVVAKFAYPRRFAPSIGASRAFSGHAGVPVIDADEIAGFLLMSKVEPGHSLLAAFSNGKDDHATDLAADAIRRLRAVKPPDSGFFRHVKDDIDAFSRWQARNESSAKDFPSAWIDRAESMFIELLQDDTPTVLLHGDLHHDNVVIDGDGQAHVIDPKGKLGDPAYEVGAWMRNPMDLYDVENPSRLLSRRLDIFCDTLGDDRQRLRRWAFVQMCLAAMGLYEDDQEIWPRALEFSELLLRA